MNRDEIKEEISLFDLCKIYNIKVRNNMINCPFHNDKNPSCSIFNKGKNFYCFSCGATGDVFNFVMKMEEIPFFEAYRKLGGTSKKLDSHLINEKRLKRRAKEILLNINYLLIKSKITKSHNRLKEMFNKDILFVEPNLPSKPCWFEYLNSNGEEIAKIPPLIASYVYEEFSIEKRYEYLNGLLKIYNKAGYYIRDCQEDYIFTLIDEYCNLCKFKAANLKSLDRVILKNM